jgi:hypothetical protein
MLTTHRKLSVLAVSLAAALCSTAFGAGSELQPARFPDASPGDSAGYLSKEIASISKTIYTLSAQQGTYGRKLAEDGWVFVPVHPGAVPNSPDTVVYFNSALDHADIDALADFYTTFKGTLVVDSEKVYDTSNQKSRPAGRPVEQETLASDTGNETLEAFYKDLSRGKGLIPHGTALVSMGLKRVVYAVSVGSDGSFNGMSWDMFKSNADLVVSAAENVHAASKLAAAHADGQKILDYSRLDTFVSFENYQEGWWARGYVNVNAFKLTDGKKLVAARVSTGTAGATCLVRQQRCGVYPATTEDIAWINAYNDSYIQANSYAMGYEATVGVNSVPWWSNLIEYSPSADAWTSTDAIQKDYSERTWSVGFALGGSLNLTEFTPSVSASFSRAETFTRRTDRWRGVAWNSPLIKQLTRIGSWPDIYSVSATSGISLLDSYRKQVNGFPGSRIRINRPEWGADIAAHELKLSNALMPGLSWHGCGTYRFDVNTPARPRLSYEGYQPGVAAVFEVVDYPYWTKVVNAAVTWHRSSDYYYYNDAWTCHPTYGGGIKQAGWLKGSTSGIATTSNGNYKTYQAYINVSVPETYFANN